MTVLGSQDSHRLPAAVDRPNGGFGVLHANEDGLGPNWPDIVERNKSKYLRERHWLRQWQRRVERKRRFVHIGSVRERRLKDLGRSLNDPGDAFFEVSGVARKSFMSVTVWAEVTEVFQPEYAPMVDQLVRKFNGIRLKRDIDAEGFLQDFDLAPPDARKQCEMADQVIEAIERKARKGMESGSYHSLVRDYGQGTLIVGLPLWFAGFPLEPRDPDSLLTEFAPRVAAGLDAISGSVLRADWCPFHSIFVIWNTSFEMFDAWAKSTDAHAYDDPAMAGLDLISARQMAIFMRPLFSEDSRVVQKVRESGTPIEFNNFVRWDRYSSFDAMLAAQQRRLRCSNVLRPFGPRAGLEICDASDLYTYMHALDRWLRWWHIRLFVSVHGWKGIMRRIARQLSITRVYLLWRIRREARRNYGQRHR